MPARVLSVEFVGTCTIRQKAIHRSKFHRAQRSSICPITGVVRSATLHRRSSFRWTTKLAGPVAELARHFEAIYREQMQGLPIVNPKLEVEAVDFCDYEGCQLGVLITPWFMNLVILPNHENWVDSPQGSTSNIYFPSGPIEFTTSQDETLGSFLTAVLFRTVSDIPEQGIAREIASQVMRDLFVSAHNQTSMSRRALFTGSKAS
jgi:[NiFe] hydrogenase assembly HybE family chaperone